MTKFWLIRHGATKLNNDTNNSVDRIRGWSDVPLSEEGRKEAEKTAIRLQGKGIDILVHSDLGRSAETAQIIGKKLGIKTVPSKELRPWNLGTFTGTSTKEAIPQIAEYVKNKPNKPVPKGESFDSFKSRAFRGVSEAIKKHPGKLVGVVTHHRVERLMRAWINAGQPSNKAIDLATFLEKGEHTGNAEELKINPLGYMARADGGQAQQGPPPAVPPAGYPTYGMSPSFQPLVGKMQIPNYSGTGGYSQSINPNTPPAQVMMASKMADGGTPGQYKIQPGDTLSGLSKKLGMSVDALMALNPNIKDKNKIRAGDTLSWQKPIPPQPKIAGPVVAKTSQMGDIPFPLKGDSPTPPTSTGDPYLGTKGGVNFNPASANPGDLAAALKKNKDWTPGQEVSPPPMNVEIVRQPEPLPPPNAMHPVPPGEKPVTEEQFQQQLKNTANRGFWDKHGEEASRALGDIGTMASMAPVAGMAGPSALVTGQLAGLGDAQKFRDAAGMISPSLKYLQKWAGKPGTDPLAVPSNNTGTAPPTLSPSDIGNVSDPVLTAEKLFGGPNMNDVTGGPSRVWRGPSGDSWRTEPFADNNAVGNKLSRFQDRILGNTVGVPQGTGISRNVSMQDMGRQILRQQLLDSQNQAQDRLNTTVVPETMFNRGGVMKKRGYGGFADNSFNGELADDNGSPFAGLLHSPTTSVQPLPQPRRPVSPPVPLPDRPDRSSFEGMADNRVDQYQAGPQWQSPPPPEIHRALEPGLGHPDENLLPLALSAIPELRPLVGVPGAMKWLQQRINNMDTAVPIDKMPMPSRFQSRINDMDTTVPNPLGMTSHGLQGRINNMDTAVPRFIEPSLQARINKVDVTPKHYLDQIGRLFWPDSQGMASGGPTHAKYGVALPKAITTSPAGAPKQIGSGPTGSEMGLSIRTGRMASGFLHSQVPGRTDKLNLNVKNGSYVLPADIVSGHGQGNSLAGASLLGKMFGMGPYGATTSGIRGASPPRYGHNMFGMPPPFRSAGGKTHVPVLAAGGEFIVPPEVVSRIGGGDQNRGFRILDRFVLDSRKKHVKEIKHLKPPRKD